MASARLMAEVVPETPTLFSAVLWSGGEEVKEDYEICHLNFKDGDNQCTVYTIPITVIAKRLLVAVPFEAWHRTASERFLPKTALSKAVLVELEGFSVDEFGGAGEATTVKACVGYLRADLAKTGCVGEADEPGALDFTDEESELKVVPFAKPLVDVANEMFSFQTATSTMEGDGDRPVSAGEVEQRFSKLEDSLEAIRMSLQQLPGVGSGLLKAQPKPSAAKAEEREGKKKKYQGLDAGVVQSARQVGIPEDHIERLAAMMAKPNRMEEAAGPAAGLRTKNVLSETEDEQEEEMIPDGPDAGGASGSAGGAVEKAVVQLTKLVSDMSKAKNARTGLDAILDRVDTGGGDASASSSTGGRSKSAAFKKLRDALVKNPEWLYKNVEARMEEDFQTLRMAPGASGLTTTPRAWIEHRSKLLHYPSTIRSAWIVAGIHDSLKAGNVSEARARCALALAAIDQSSLDNGSWMLSQEMLLEDAAPYSAFLGRRAPDMSEQAATKLVDERFLEVMVWRLKDRDNYIESRKRLSQALRSRGGDPATQNPPVKVWDPVPKVKPKAKPKWQRQREKDAPPQDGAEA